MPASPKSVSLGKILFPNQRGSIPSVKHADGSTTPPIKSNKPVEYIPPRNKDDEFFVPPPYRVATLPGHGVATAVYVDPETLKTTTSEWEGVGLVENTIWGIFKAFTIARAGQVLGIDKALSSMGGVAVGSGTTEHLTVEKKTTTHTATVSDWNGQVYFGLLGGVKAIDFQSLSNPRELVLEQSDEFRIMAGDEVVYISEPEITTITRVSDYIPNKKGFPAHDVHY